jgi:hypothetical protein
LAVTGPAHVEDLLYLLRNDQASPEVRGFAARGILPLDSDDRLRALFAVLKDPDPEIAATARATVAQFPPDTFADFLRGEKVLPAEIETIAGLTDDILVLEQVVRHRNVSDATLATLARTVTGAAQEALVVNQVRLLGNPSIIDALYENPGLTADSRRMLNELREEFFEKEARRHEARRLEAAQRARPAAEPGPEPPKSTDVGADAADLDDEGEEETSSPHPAADPSILDVHDPTGGAEEIYLQIMKMTVPERVKLALRGAKEHRRFLIADTSRIVSLAVLRARGLTITEVEGFCAMRHVDDEVFYAISRKRDWVRRPSVMITLVRNPKVPFAITRPLIPRLSLRELRNIFRDRNLPEPIRVVAKKTYLQKRK